MQDFFDIDGLRLRVAVDGSEAAPPLVLINGAYSNLESFTPVLAPLAARFRVVRHDWRGTGQSDGGPRAAYRFERYADDLALILDRLDIEHAIVCGMAYGARVAARFALRHPARTDLLALYDVSLDQPVDQELQRQGNETAKQLRKEAGLVEPTRSRTWFEHRDQREAMRSLTAHVDQSDPTPELARIAIPTLVVCGRQDVNLGEAQRIAGIVPDAEFHVMEMTGHGSAQSRPDLFASLLIDFVKRRG